MKRILLIGSVLPMLWLSVASCANIALSVQSDPEQAAVGQIVHITATLTNEAPLPAPITLTASISYMCGSQPVTSTASCYLWIVHPVYVPAVRIEMLRLNYIDGSYNARPPPYWHRGSFWLPINDYLSEQQKLEVSFDAVVI